jgi:hypothetical protein
MVVNLLSPREVPAFWYPLLPANTRVGRIASKPRANSINDDGQSITGWKTRIQDHIDYIRYTPVDIIVDPDDYTVMEFSPLETNWQQTTPNPVLLTLADGEDKTAEFGNLCLGAGGGKTLGFWSNNNGSATMNDGGTRTLELTLLSSLNLRRAGGGDFYNSPDSPTYALYRTWLLDANAVNMADMLSAQLSAMELNVEAGLVDGGALVYAPDANSANSLGYTTINDLMAEADTELGLHGVTKDGNQYRPYQQVLKNAPDRGNSS